MKHFKRFFKVEQSKNCNFQQFTLKWKKQPLMYMYKNIDDQKIACIFNFLKFLLLRLEEGICFTDIKIVIFYYFINR